MERGRRDAFDDILRFWFDRGVAGFRIDVAHGIVKDRELRDNPDPAVSTYNANRDEVHDVLRRWRAARRRLRARAVLLGETWVMELDRLARFYGRGATSCTSHSTSLSCSPISTQRTRACRQATEAVLPADAWPVWTLSNHDIVRFPTRMVWTRTTRGSGVRSLPFSPFGATPVLYYGDELGMRQVKIPTDRELTCRSRRRADTAALERVGGAIRGSRLVRCRDCGGAANGRGRCSTTAAT